MTGGVSGRVEDRWKQAAGGYGGGGRGVIVEETGD